MVGAAGVEGASKVERIQGAVLIEVLRYTIFWLKRLL